MCSTPNSCTDFEAVFTAFCRAFLGRSPRQGIHIEDSVRNILGARKAGIKIVNPKKARLPKNIPAPNAQVRTVQAAEKIIANETSKPALQKNRKKNSGEDQKPDQIEEDQNNE